MKCLQKHVLWLLALQNLCLPRVTLLLLLLALLSLPGIVNRKVFVRMSQAERVHYDLFIERLVQQTTASVTSSCSSSDSSSRASSNSKAGSKRPSSGSRGSTMCTPSHLAATAYGMAVLGVSSPPLAAAVEQASAALLQQAAAAVSAAASEAAVQQPPAAAAASEEEAEGVSSAAAAAAAVAAAEVCGWTPADVASLLWGLGMLRHCPSQQWLQDVTTVSQHMLAR
jgi:cytoskeletal protein RodZ